MTTDEAVEGGFATTDSDVLDTDPVEVVLGVDEMIKDLVGRGKVDVLADELVHDLHVGLLRAIKGHSTGDVLHDLADEDEGARLLAGDGLRGTGEKGLAGVDDVRADVAQEEEVGERRVPHVMADAVLQLLEELDDDERAGVLVLADVVKQTGDEDGDGLSTGLHLLHRRSTVDVQLNVDTD